MVVGRICRRLNRSRRFAFSSFIVGVGVACGTITVLADPLASRPIHFELPSQPLAQALDDLSSATGVEILYDSELAHRRRSSAVNGNFSAYDALQIMLRGTGLTPRAIAPDAITLIPEGSSKPGPYSLGDRQYATYNSYFRLVQSRLEQALCQHQDLRSGDYRSVLEFWINPSGQIVNPHLLGSTGSADRDRQMAAALANVVVAKPPEELQQPIMIVILPRQSGAVLQCKLGNAAP